MTGKGAIAAAAAAAVLLGGAFILAGGGKRSVPPPPGPPLVEYLNESITNDMSDFPELGKMDFAVDSFMQKWELKGMSVAITRNDSLVFAKGYGYSDVGKGVRMAPGTKLRMASVSKLVTAVGIMQLQDQGRLNIQTPVFGPFGILREYDRYIRDDNYYMITVENLLRHEAGFTTRGGDPMFSTLSMMRAMERSTPPDQDALTKYLVRRPLQYVPGEDKAYSNFGYLLLSMVIEKVTGLPYENYMRDSVLARAGVRDFRIAGNYLRDRHDGETMYYMNRDAELCSAFDGSGAKVEKCYGGNDITTLSGAGAWTGSTIELARLVASIDGLPGIPDIISPESFSQMTVFIDEDSYGLGWNDCKPSGELTRTGSFSGTSAVVKVFPDGECWILITNTSSWQGSRFSRNTRALIGKLRSRFSASLPRQDLFRQQ